MSLHRLLPLLAATAATLGLGACASAPEGTDTAPRAVIGDPITGSNIPRRDPTRKPVNNVTTTTAEGLKEVFNKPQIPEINN
ncbi:hypothetical protein ABXN37_17915 [Piscinibacter sakaiensis]|uniref:Lipoprotein n=1 Tax=Piscinibacter sakaiensis TaxID=1547922 RepID=A0A0K8P303_PISS1|nr:hypothetical protein [Piscinibacter sakaiensis]GAP37021.1 hypothetical protein ISF6_2876 [Piscinibacter sakaiensis]